MQIPIQSLYNIFNHKNRHLNKHDEAYELIKQSYENSGNSNFFILLESLEGSRLSKKNLQDTISQRLARDNHMVSIDFAFLNTIVEKNKEYESKIAQSRIEIAELKEENKKMMMQQNELNKKIDTLMEMQQKEDMKKKLSK